VRVEHRDPEQKKETKGGLTLPAQLYDAGFHPGHGNFECLYQASDGNLYYMIASHVIEYPAQMYRFNPASETITHVADLGDVLGSRQTREVPQGKGHVNFHEHQGKLYTATHVGFYKHPTGEDDFVELLGTVEGYAPYPGGYFLSYDLSTGRFEALAKAPEKEGIITMILDKDRERLYGLTWPGGLFLYYDLPTRTLKNLGPVFGKGEAGDFKRGEWKLICRNFALDPRDGNLYWTRAKGELLRYRFEQDTIDIPDGCDFKNPDFGPLSDHSLWRSIVWSDKEQAFYGVHYKANYLFRFDSRALRVEPIVSIGAEPYNDPSMWTEDYLPFRIYHWYWSTLAFKLGPDGETLYYLASGPAPADGENYQATSTTRLITYHIPTGTYRDHGTARLPDGRYPSDPQCIEVAGGKVYCVQKVEIPLDDHLERANSIRKAWAKKEKDYVEETNLIAIEDPTW